MAERKSFSSHCACQRVIEIIMFNARTRSSLVVRLEPKTLKDLVGNTLARLSPLRIVTLSPREELCLAPTKWQLHCVSETLLCGVKKLYKRATWYYCVFKFDPLLNPTEIWCATHEWLCAKGIILTYKWNLSSVNITRRRKRKIMELLGSFLCREEEKRKNIIGAVLAWWIGMDCR